MNLKVLFVIATNNIGGQELSLFDRIQGLRRLGIPCEVLLPKEGRLSDFLKRQHVTVHIFDLCQLTKKNPFPYLKTVIRIVRLVKAEKFDLIHCSGAYPHQYCLPAARFCDIPCVVHVNSTVYSERGLRISFMKHTDFIVAISEAVKTNILSKVKMEPQKIRVIYNGILDEESYTDVPVGNNGVDIRRELGIAEGVKVVGQIGNVFPEKGLEYFIHMAKIIKDDSSQKVKFLIIGQIWQNAYWTKLEALIDELDLKNDVIFTGFKPDIKNFIDILDVSVLASVAEGHGRAVVESLALGKAVVGTNVGGIPETIKHEETGLLVAPRDPKALAEAVLELLEDNEKAKRLGAKGKDFVFAHFSKGRHSRLILETYKMALVQKQVTISQKFTKCVWYASLRIKFIVIEYPKRLLLYVLNFLSERKENKRIGFAVVGVIALVVSPQKAFLIFVVLTILFVLSMRLRDCLMTMSWKNILKALKDTPGVSEALENFSYVTLEQFVDDQWWKTKIKHQLIEQPEVVLAEIDQGGRCYSHTQEIPYFKNISREEFIPRKRYVLQIVVLKDFDNIIAVKKNFLADTKAAIKEAYILNKLRHCNTPKLLRVDLKNNIIYMTLIPGFCLKTLLLQEGLQFDHDKIKKDEVSQGELTALKEHVQRHVDIEELYHQILKINSCGVIIEDMKYGNVIIESKTRKPFLLDFHEAKYNENIQGLKFLVMRSQMTKSFNRNFFVQKPTIELILSRLNKFRYSPVNLGYGLFSESAWNPEKGDGRLNYIKEASEWLEMKPYALDIVQRDAKITRPRAYGQAFINTGEE